MCTGITLPHPRLGRAFQLMQLPPNLPVVENVRLAVQARRKQGLNLWSVWLDQRWTLDRAIERIADVKLADRADVPAVRSSRSSIDVRVELSDTLRPRTMSLPHGWLHETDVPLGVATLRSGANTNRLTDDRATDQPSGTPVFNGIQVEVIARRSERMRRPWLATCESPTRRVIQTLHAPSDESGSTRLRRGPIAVNREV